jgi:hypothetical protein
MKTPFTLFSDLFIQVLNTSPRPPAMQQNLTWNHCIDVSIAPSIYSFLGFGPIVEVKKENLD